MGARLDAAETAEQVVLMSSDGTVEVLPQGAVIWQAARVNAPLHPGDRVRTGENSRAMLRYGERTQVQLGEFSETVILLPTQGQGFLNMIKGWLHLLHRGRPGRYELQIPTAQAIILGTEFTVYVAPNGSTRIDLLEGDVQLGNAYGKIRLSSGTSAQVDAETAPRPIQFAGRMRAVEWCLYYPAILDLSELDELLERHPELRPSVEHYRVGDALAAIHSFPWDAPSQSAAERLYRAALRVAAGHSGKAMDELGLLETGAAARAGRFLGPINGLKLLVATVQSEDRPAALSDRALRQSTTYLLAESFYHQAHLNFDAARASVRTALAKNPNFAAAWARLAELEFCVGRIPSARAAVREALRLAPRNSGALVTSGFLAGAGSQTALAQTQFEEAIQLDPRNGNAWLGHGLMLIKSGRRAEGVKDLQAAAALEPQRSLFRSYLGKGYADQEEWANAERELTQAETLDPQDPTPWLYSALLHRQANQLNRALEDLERSRALNQNRQIFRSQLLLDQDASVRGTDLAGIYQDVGLFDRSLAEASQALTIDYANYSAHLLLAESYNAWRDPNQVNLRYETSAVHEFLLANLLAPPGALTFSPQISQNEYTRFFDRNRLGINTRTEYLSSGTWRQESAQYGVFDSSAYAVESIYYSRNGQRANNDFEAWALNFRLKQQLTLQDSVYLQVTRYEADGGDVRPLFQEGLASPSLRVSERQDPLFLVGYNHAWSAAAHTLLLFGHLEDRVTRRDRNAQVDVLDRDPFDPAAGIRNVDRIPVTLDYSGWNRLNSIEVQQVQSFGNHSFTAGTALQHQALSASGQVRDGASSLGTPIDSRDDGEAEGSRIGTYAFWRWHMTPRFHTVAGVSFDWLQFPENLGSVPFSTKLREDASFSPKAGLLWSVTDDLLWRLAGAQSLSGIGVEQSLGLEPVDVAGFLDNTRNLIPESVVGSTSALETRVAGSAMDWRPLPHTYLSIAVEVRTATGDRSLPAYEEVIPVGGLGTPSLVPVSFRDRIRFEEQIVRASASQLLGSSGSIGIDYRWSRARLAWEYPDTASDASFPGTESRKNHRESSLHRFGAWFQYQNAQGWFGRVQPAWYFHTNRDYVPAIGSDTFWQIDVWAGRRLFHRHLELAVGVLNLTGDSFHLNPMVLQTDLPKERTFAMICRFNF